MPYPNPHALLTILGDAYGGSEIWQTGLRLATPGEPDTATMEAIDAAVTTFLQTTALRFPSGFRYIGLKFAPQDVNGRYPAGTDATEWLRPTPLAGNVSGGFPQIALVTSWRTSRTRGYASNGRSYWPSVQVINATTGRFPASEGLAVATAAANLVAAIRDTTIGVPSVMSTVGAGLSEPIIGARVGLVMDTQRRRRSAIAEEYTETQEVPL